MTDQQHPITPPLNLVTSLRNSAPRGIRDAGVTREIWLINSAFAFGADQQLKLDAEQIAQAYQKGADRELEACCEWLTEKTCFHPESDLIKDIRAARRPKPPSLKEQALKMLADVERCTGGDFFIIRRALEALPE